MTDRTEIPLRTRVFDRKHRTLCRAVSLNALEEDPAIIDLFKDSTRQYRRLWYVSIFAKFELVHQCLALISGNNTPTTSFSFYYILFESITSPYPPRCDRTG